MISEMARRAPASFARLAEESDGDLFFRAGKAIRRSHRLRLDGKVRHPQTIVEERVAFHVEIHAVRRP